MRAVKVVDGKARVDKALCNDCGVCVEKCPFGVTPAVDEPVFAVFVGGTWGKHTRMGTRLNRYYKREELDALVEKTILWFRENAFVKERLGAAIDRVGVDAFEAAHRHRRSAFCARTPSSPRPSRSARHEETTPRLAADRAAPSALHRGGGRGALG